MESLQRVLTQAAERHKICSPRRQPWVWIVAHEIAAERRNSNDNQHGFRPCRGWFGSGVSAPWLTPWATDLLPLRGYLRSNQEVYATKILLAPQTRATLKRRAN